VVDGGVCQVGVASTILDVSGDVPVILRQGTITRAQLEQVIGKPVLDGTVS
jgi:L-threonylcarbamoyladenylate synthase